MSEIEVFKVVTVRGMNFRSWYTELPEDVVVDYEIGKPTYPPPGGGPLFAYRGRSGIHQFVCSDVRILRCLALEHKSRHRERHIIAPWGRYLTASNIRRLWSSTRPARLSKAIRLDDDNVVLCDVITPLEIIQ